MKQWDILMTKIYQYAIKKINQLYLLMNSLKNVMTTKIKIKSDIYFNVNSVLLDVVFAI